MDKLPPLPGAAAGKESGPLEALTPWDLEGVDWDSVGRALREVPASTGLDFMELTLDIEEGLKILGDAEALETTLRNLVENAVLYSDDAPNITVTLKPDGHFAHLVVADRGRGLERKEINKVFDMFYRARRKDENIRGSGLGLFIVQTVVRHHQGKVWLESAGVGQGCAVHILLPLAPPESNP
jgi:signal transduction histidine kinase